MNKALNYKDVYLIPNYSKLYSRSDAVTSFNFGDFSFKIPVVPANMASTISFELAEYLGKNGYFYILHRFFEYEKILKWIGENQKENNFPISISIGIQKRDIDLIQTIVKNQYQVNFITVDVAHGDHEKVYKIIQFLNHIRSEHNLNFKIIAGNIATISAYKSMIEAQVDAVKVGIASGLACCTYNKTGFFTPMFSTLLQISKFKSSLINDKIPLVIADGGIRENGDIVKALVAGADIVMAGGLFAQCENSPARSINNKKEYFGSASTFNNNEKHIEGRMVLIESNHMTYMQKLQEITEDISSAISYAGGKDLSILNELEVRWNKL
jgi:GMP reductase